MNQRERPLHRGPGSAARPRSPEAAFSLAEVAIAIGILAFCLVGVLGLIPAAMGMFRESVDTGLRAQIMQQVSADVGMMDYTNFVDVSSGTVRGNIVDTFRRFYGEDGQTNGVTEATAILSLSIPKDGSGNIGIKRVELPGGVTVPFDSACNIQFVIKRSEFKTNIFSVIKANDGR